MERKTLLFAVPIFSPGLNVTVRRGVQWDLVDKRDVHMADAEEPEKILMIRDIETKVMCFQDITDQDIVHNHVPDARTEKGLLRVMLDVYPGFDEREIVTVVSFWI